MNYYQTLKFGSNKLKLNNIDTHILDSELLLSYTLNLPREKVLINLNSNINKHKLNLYKKLLSRRERKEPIAYIVKKKEFWRNNFYVNNNVLIPRPETEIIVEEVLKILHPESSKRLLDIGTGSGCLILSIIKERPKSYGTAIDVSKKALNVAKFNAKMHHLQNKIKFINIDVDKYEDNKYDFIISNPPYINNFECRRLEKNVLLYEPFIALKAGIDGFSEIKKIVYKSSKLLKLNGKLIFEIGGKQMFKTLLLLKKNGFYVNDICRDIQLHPRVIVSTKIL